MSEHERPHQGGSYFRKPDGSLELVERTTAVDPAEAPEPAPAEKRPAPNKRAKE